MQGKSPAILAKKSMAGLDEAEGEGGREGGRGRERDGFTVLERTSEEAGAQ
jgi:hypothetical protein